MVLILLKLFEKTQEKTLPKFYCEASAILIQTPEKGITRKETIASVPDEHGRKNPHTTLAN